MFWGLLSTVKVLKVVVCNVVFSCFFFLLGEIGVLGFLLIVGHCSGNGVYGEVVSQLFLFTSVWGFSCLLCFVRVAQLFPPRGNYFI